MHKVRTKGRFYYYAWRGGPSLPDPEIVGVTAFLAAYERLTAAKVEKPIGPTETIATLVCAYRMSPQWARLSDESRRVRSFRIKTILKDFGDMDLEALKAKGVRKLFEDWRDGMADRPRAADDHLDVLCQILNWGVDRELVDKNPATGIPGIYRSNRSDVTFTDDELERLLAVSKADFARLLVFARWTGLRRGDLIGLKWADVDLEAGVIRRWTDKSRKTVRTFIPILPPVRQALEGLTGGRSDQCVLLRDGRPWEAKALSDVYRHSCERAGLVGKHMHDLRGTIATDLDGLVEDHELERWMGWKPGQAAMMRRVYVNQREAAKRIAQRLSKLFCKTDGETVAAQAA